MLSSCTSYVTPGGAVNLNAINDFSIKDSFATKAAAKFPAHVAMVRIQSSGYSSYTSRSYGYGKYSIVTSREIEDDDMMKKLLELPQLKGVATLNRLMIPDRLDTVKDVRRAVAPLHADMLFLYTVDTDFYVKDRSIAPLTTLSLGFFPDDKAYITSTASAVLYDVRTGHVYGLAEATEKSEHRTNVWSKKRVIDKARLTTEKAVFKKLVENFCLTWPKVLESYAGK